MNLEKEEEIKSVLDLDSCQQSSSCAIGNIRSEHSFSYKLFQDVVQSRQRDGFSTCCLYDL